MTSIEKKKKITYKIRKLIHSKKKPKIYYERMQQQAIVAFKRNNMFFNICGRLREKPHLYSNFYWTSGGAEKFSPLQFKGATKLTFLANFAFGQFLKKRMGKLQFPGTTFVCFKGSGRYFSAFAKGFISEKIKIKLAIMDITNVALNGCRLRKKRRV